MSSYARSALVLGLWFFLLLGLFTAQRLSVRLSERISARLPLMVVLPRDFSSEQRQNFESGIPGVRSFHGATVEFISRDAGMARAHQTLVESGFPPDSSVLDYIPENPIPDVYVVRTADIGQYEKIAGDASTLLPRAQIQYPASAHRFLSPVLTAARWSAIAALILAAVLFCFSAAREFAAATPADAGRIIPAALWLSSISALGAISVGAGLGFAADRWRPASLCPYSDIASRLFREVPVDWKFLAVFLSGWLGLSLLAAIICRIRDRISEVS